MKTTLLFLFFFFAVSGTVPARERKLMMREEIVGRIARASKVLPRAYLDSVFESPLLGIDTVMLRDMKEKRYDLRTFLDSLYSPESVSRGKRFLEEYKDTLGDVHERYGVPPAPAVAIIRVESDLGRNLGKYLAMNVYYTLYARASRSWKRRQGVLREWRTFLEACYKNDICPYLITSSWAGAIGLCQFMPSNFGLARDGDGDGVIDIAGSMPDALASAANFLERNGYRRDPRRAVLRYVGGTMGTSGWYVRAVFTYAKLIATK